MKKTYTHFLKPLLMLAIMALLSKQIFAQSAPNISYSGAQTYMVGKPINPLSPTNTGGAVPATIYGQVSTLAGSGKYAFADGTGKSASFYAPNAVATDAAGNVYVADDGNYRIRKITPAGVVTTIAGSGLPNFANATGAAASFRSTMGVATDAAGNVYVADAIDNRIRKISPDGVVTTFAGSGIPTYTDATGKAASFKYPNGVATDPAGNVYVADAGNNRIRKISPDGVVTTIAGNNNAGYVDGSGIQAAFYAPVQVATDATGNVYVADANNNRIRKISPAGVVTTLAGSSTAGYADGSVTTAIFNQPVGIAIDAVGNVYVADQGNHLIRKISPAGMVTTLAGSGKVAFADGTGTAASFGSLTGVATDAVGNIYASEAYNNRIRKISLTGYSINAPLPPGLIFDATTGTISGTPLAFIKATTYTITAYNLGGSSTTTLSLTVNLPPPPQITYSGAQSYTLNTPITSISPTNTGGAVPPSIFGNVTTFAGTGQYNSSDGQDTVANFSFPFGVTADRKGNVFVADADNYLIRKIDPMGNVSTFAGSGYVGSDDGQGAAASFGDPTGVAIDKYGNVYVSDAGNNLIRKIDPMANVTTIAGNGSSGFKNGKGTAASFGAPEGVAVDTIGNLYVVDNTNNVIRKIDPAGNVTTFAGSGRSGSKNGLGTEATFFHPFGIAIDITGNLYVSDSNNNLIRKIDPLGNVTTLAGSMSLASKNGKGTAASFYTPMGIAVDVAGNVYVGESGTNLIRKIDPTGNVTTLAGSGRIGALNGLGTTASFNNPIGLCTDAMGNVYVADNANNIIRKISTTGFSISSKLPVGLNFDATTGIISGTPISLSPATNYTISGYNLSGNSTTTLNLAVLKAQTITFPNLASSVYGSADLTNVASTTSNLPISYTSSNTNVATITNTGTIHIVGTGTTTITASQAGDLVNYAAATPVAQPLTVTQAPLTITATNQTMVYGGTLPNLTYTATGFVNGDDLTKLTSPVISNTTASGTTPSGSYPITVSGATATNYSITFVPGTLTINQAALTITADNQTKYYGDDNPTLTYTFSGFVNNEDASVLTTAASITANATAASVVGTYPITVSAAAALNYAITFVPGTLTINTAPAPTITLIDNTTATTGNTIHLTGTYFLGATAVNFGGTAAASFTINSATSITAVVGNGASGSITVTTPSGTGTLTGFNFVPAPTIATSGPTTILSDGAGVTLTANPMSGGYTYQWQNNGVNINGATNASYTTTQSGNYTVIITLNSVSQTSAATTVTSVFDLTANNYHLTVTGETCNGSSNGSVAVTADANLNYIVILTGSGISTITQKFSSTTTFNNLPAGSYTLTFTVDGQTSYSKAYTVTVTQPQPLSVFATVNEAAGNIELNLSGGSVYHIQLNNKTYTTTESNFSVSLEQGNNALQVSTDRECQGIFTKLINPSFNISPYPMPFESTLNLNLGSSNIATVSVRIYSTNTGLQVFTGDYQNQSGVLQLDLSKLAKGAYGMQLIINNTKKEFKIIK